SERAQTPVSEERTYQVPRMCPGEEQQTGKHGPRRRDARRRREGAPERAGSNARERGAHRPTRRSASCVGETAAPGGTRTHDLQVRNLTLYPLSYGRTMPTGRLAEREGFEPSEQVTPLGGLANRCTRPLCDLSVRRPEYYHRPNPLPADGPAR